jgi:hypothetical protein
MTLSATRYGAIPEKHYTTYKLLAKYATLTSRFLEEHLTCSSEGVWISALEGAAELFYRARPPRSSPINPRSGSPLQYREKMRRINYHTMKSSPTLADLLRTRATSVTGAGKSVRSRVHLINHHHLHALFSDLRVHTHTHTPYFRSITHGPPPIQTILSAIPVVLSYNNLYYRAPLSLHDVCFPQATFLPTPTLVIRNLMNRLCLHTPSVLHTPVDRPFLSGLASAQLPNGF